MIGPIGSSSPLQLTNFWYNGTLVCSNVSSGTLTVISGEVSGRVTYKHQPGVKPVPGVGFNAAGSVNFVGGPSDVNGLYTLSALGGCVCSNAIQADKLNPGGSWVTPPRTAYLVRPRLYLGTHGRITPITIRCALDAAWSQRGNKPFVSSFDCPDRTVDRWHR